MFLRRTWLRLLRRVLVRRRLDRSWSLHGPLLLGRMGLSRMRLLHGSLRLGPWLYGVRLRHGTLRLSLLHRAWLRRMRLWLSRMRLRLCRMRLHDRMRLWLSSVRLGGSRIIRAGIGRLRRVRLEWPFCGRMIGRRRSVGGGLPGGLTGRCRIEMIGRAGTIGCRRMIAIHGSQRMKVADRRRSGRIVIILYRRPVNCQLSTLDARGARPGGRADRHGTNCLVGKSFHIIGCGSS